MTILLTCTLLRTGKGFGMRDWEQERRLTEHNWRCTDTTMVFQTIHYPNHLPCGRFRIVKIAISHIQSCDFKWSKWHWVFNVNWCSVSLKMFRHRIPDRGQVILGLHDSDSIHAYMFLPGIANKRYGPRAILPCEVLTTDHRIVDKTNHELPYCSDSFS